MDIKTANGIVRLYLGAPFKTGSYGPDTFDCYGLVWEVNRRHADRELPRFDDIDYQLARLNAHINNQALSADWQRVDTPTDFDIVLLQRNQADAYHVGVYLDAGGGKILHALDGHGVVCNDRNALVRMGFKKVEFYRYAGD